MKHIKVFIFLVAPLLMCACPEREENFHPYITIINMSIKGIVWQPRMIKIGEKNEYFDCNYVIGGRIDANSQFKFEFDDRGNNWDDKLNSQYLQITVMNLETFDRYKGEACDTIRKYVPVLQTYRLTLADLQRMNWTVVYPPEK